MDSSERTTNRRFSPFVISENVRVERGGGFAFIAKNQLTVERGGGQWFLSAGNLDVRQGGAATLVARTSRIESGFVGVLAAWNVHLAPGARVLLRVTPAVSVALAVGFAAGWLLCGHRSLT